MTEVVSLLVLNAILVSALVLIAVQICRALQDALQTLDSVHSRSQETVEDVLNRLMARDFDHYQLYELAKPDANGHNEVEETTMGDVHRGRPWIPLPPEPSNVPEDFNPEEEGLPK